SGWHLLPYGRRRGGYSGQARRPGGAATADGHDLARRLPQLAGGGGDQATGADGHHRRRADSRSAVPDYQHAAPVRGAATLPAGRGGHWGIGNRLHYAHDVTMGEDANRTRTGSGPSCWRRSGTWTSASYGSTV